MSRELLNPLRVDTDFSSTIYALADHISQLRCVPDSNEEFRLKVFHLLVRLAHCDLESIVRSREKLRSELDKLTPLDA